MLLTTACKSSIAQQLLARNPGQNHTQLSALHKPAHHANVYTYMLNFETRAMKCLCCLRTQRGVPAVIGGPKLLSLALTCTVTSEVGHNPLAASSSNGCEGRELNLEKSLNPFCLISTLRQPSQCFWKASNGLCSMCSQAAHGMQWDKTFYEQAHAKVLIF